MLCVQSVFLIYRRVGVEYTLIVFIFGGAHSDYEAGVGWRCDWLPSVLLLGWGLRLMRQTCDENNDQKLYHFAEIAVFIL